MARTTQVASIKPHELHRLLKEREDVLIVDVREPDEHREWRIPGSVNIPLADLARGAPLVPAKHVVVYCARGGRSQSAQRQLRERGIPAVSLEGGMMAWNGVYEHASLRTRDGAEIVQVQRLGKGCLSYVIVKREEAAVIDPTLDIHEYVEILRARGARIVAVFDTHAHADHVSGGRALADATGAVYYAPDELGASIDHEPLVDGQRVLIGDGHVEVVATPGHTPGSVTLLFEDVAFTGDTLFVDSVGRPDLGQEGAVNAGVLWRTLRERVRAFSHETRVLAGHHAMEDDELRGAIGARLSDILSRVPQLSWDELPFVAWVEQNQTPKPANFEAIKRLNQGLDRIDDVVDVRVLEAGPNGCAVSRGDVPNTFSPPAVSTVVPAQAEALLREGRGILVDVREPSERAEARIPGARHIPLGELALRLRELPRDRKLILQCRSGARSLSAAELLVASGFADVANLEGGIIRWAREGRPVEA